MSKYSLAVLNGLCNYKITKEGAAPEQKSQLIWGATQLLVDVLEKSENYRCRNR